MIIDKTELSCRILKYIILGIVIAITTKLLTSPSCVPMLDVILIGVIGSAIYSVMDLFVPSIQLM